MILDFQLMDSHIKIDTVSIFDLNHCYDNYDQLCIDSGCYAIKHLFL